MRLERTRRGADLHGDVGRGDVLVAERAGLGGNGDVELEETVRLSASHGIRALENI